MSSLGLALNNAISGLRLNQNAMSVLSQNLANVNTDGYSREVLVQSALYSGGVGNGVKIDDIIRKVNDFLLRTVQNQSSVLQRTSVINDYQSRIQALLGQPGSGTSFDDSITTFFSGLQQLANAPDSAAARSAALSAADNLAKQVSGLASSLEDLRFQADRDMKASVDAANQQLQALYTMNRDISAASVAHQPLGGLLDKRDAALKALAEQMDISVVYNQFGAVTVTAGNGVTLVDDEQHQLTFNPSNSEDPFINDGRLSGIAVQTLDGNGNPTGTPSTLITNDTSANTVSGITGGKLAGLEQLRDSLVPEVLIELDSLAAGLRDSVNAIHNDGSAVPPANSLTGTREVMASDTYDWTGSVRIAVLNADGSPIPSQYADESDTGLRPLTLNLAMLNSGSGDGKPSVQGIIDAINQYYDSPGAKAEVGNLNNIQLVSDTKEMPGSQGLFDFDFNLENISADSAAFFVNNITVKDDGGNDMTDVSQGPKTIDLSSVNTYTTVDGSTGVTIALDKTPDGLKVGDKVYLSAPTVADINGIDPSEVTGYVTVTAIDGNTISVGTTDAANATGSVADGTPGTVQPPVDVDAGAQVRSKSDGTMQVDVSSNPASNYYDITATVTVINEDGTTSTSDITYRVTNNQIALMNDQYSATAVTGGGTRVLPATAATPLRAILVDADGRELPKVNGQYINAPGYLKLVTGKSSYGVSIDSLDSAQEGDVNGSPPDTGTGRGFSFYFELNNLFESNDPTNTGDTLKNSAINLKLEDRILNNPNLISTSKLSQTGQSSNPDDVRQYTYELNSGDNTIASAMANLGSQQIAFAAAGNLPVANVTLSTFSGYLLSSVSANAQSSENEYNNANSFYQQFTQQSQSVSGVNLDEELANTVVLQNTYSATARIITVINAMFGDLMNSVGQ